MVNGLSGWKLKQPAVSRIWQMSSWKRSMKGGKWSCSWSCPLSVLTAAATELLWMVSVCGRSLKLNLFFVSLSTFYCRWAFQMTISESIEYWSKHARRKKHIFENETHYWPSVFESHPKKWTRNDCCTNYHVRQPPPLSPLPLPPQPPPPPMPHTLSLYTLHAPQ